MREGYIVSATGDETVWLEHLWNTGETTRSWLVEPASVRDLKILIRRIDPPGK